MIEKEDTVALMLRTEYVNIDDYAKDGGPGEVS